MKYPFFSILAMALLFGACNPDPIEIDIQTADVRPVVATQFYNDTITGQSAVVIALSKSFAPHLKRNISVDSLGLHMDTSLLIGGAKVILKAGRSTYVCEELDKGFYYAWNVQLNQGDACLLEVKNQENEVLVKSQTVAMPEMRFEQVYLSKQEQKKYLHYRLADRPGKNWYVVNYLTRQKQDTAVNYQDPAYIAKQLTAQKLNFDLFTSSDFTSGRLEVKKYLGTSGFDTVAIAVSQISESYFHFLTAQKNYSKFINQVKAEVVYFPTNIEGGYGFFSMHQPKLEILLSSD